MKKNHQVEANFIITYQEMYFKLKKKYVALLNHGCWDNDFFTGVSNNKTQSVLEGDIVGLKTKRVF